MSISPLRCSRLRLSTTLSHNTRTLTTLRATSTTTAFRPTQITYQLSTNRYLSTTPKMAAIIDTVKKTIAENLTGGENFVSGEEAFTLDQCPDQSNKVAVITGGSQGIGFGITHTLLANNIAKVIIISKTEKVIEEARNMIKEEMGEEKSKRIEWIQTDISDWEAVSKVAFKIAKENDRLDILVCNAARGIMTQEMMYGIDRHFGMNHISHVILFSHLLSLLKKTAEAGHTVRVSIQASNAHEQVPSDVKFESVEELNKDLGPMALYGRSKLAAILYARYMTRHLNSTHPKILINATHPGVVETHMSTEDILEPYPVLGYLMKDAMKPFKKSQFEGAQSMVYACTKVEKSGLYVCPPSVIEPGSKLANDVDLGEQMMKLTRQIISDKMNPQAQGCPIKDY